MQSRRPFYNVPSSLSIDKKGKGRWKTQRAFSRAFNLKENETCHGLQEIHQLLNYTPEGSWMLVQFAIPRPVPEAKVLQRSFKLRLNKYGWNLFPLRFLQRNRAQGHFRPWVFSLLGQCFSVTWDSHSVKSRSGLTFCFPKQILGDANVAGPWTTL